MSFMLRVLFFIIVYIQHTINPNPPTTPDEWTAERERLANLITESLRLKDLIVKRNEKIEQAANIVTNSLLPKLTQLNTAYFQAKTISISKGVAQHSEEETTKLDQQLLTDQNILQQAHQRRIDEVEELERFESDVSYRHIEGLRSSLFNDIVTKALCLTPNTELDIPKSLTDDGLSKVDYNTIKDDFKKMSDSIVLTTVHLETIRQAYISARLDSETCIKSAVPSDVLEKAFKYIEDGYPLLTVFGLWKIACNYKELDISVPEVTHGDLKLRIDEHIDQYLEPGLHIFALKSFNQIFDGVMRDLHFSQKFNKFKDLRGVAYNEAETRCLVKKTLKNRLNRVFAPQSISTGTIIFIVFNTIVIVGVGIALVSRIFKKW